MIPDMESLLVAYLGADSEVDAIVGHRVATRTPGSLDAPWVRISVLDDPPTGRSSVDRHIEFYVQCDCYAGKGGSEEEAFRLARRVRELLGSNHVAEASHEDAVVSGSKATGSRPLLDDTEDPPLARYVVTATVWAYGLEEGS